MKPHIILQADYLDILFYNRNKLYGSYVQRKYHGRRMVQALAIVISSCMALLVWGLMPDNKPTKNATIPIVYNVTDLTDPNDILPP